MICKNIVLTAPVDRSYYPLKFIGNNRNTCAYEEFEGAIRLTIGLCVKETMALEDVSKAINRDSTMQMFFDIAEPVMHRYILEDGQVIVHIQEDGHDEHAMLLQTEYASYDDKDWDKPFHPYWKAGEGIMQP